MLARTLLSPRGSALFAVLFALTVADSAWAQVRVAFFVFRAPNGHEYSIESGGRFYHIAVSHRGQWLHADARYGVTLWSNEQMVKKYGAAVEILSSAKFAEPSPDEVASVLGMKFDATYTWNKSGTNYCSKLVGELLGIAPLPLELRDAVPSERLRRRGEVGLSPDDVYYALQVRGFKRALRWQSCEALF